MKKTLQQEYEEMMVRNYEKYIKSLVLFFVQRHQMLWSCKEDLEQEARCKFIEILRKYKEGALSIKGYATKNINWFLLDKLKERIRIAKKEVQLDDTHMKMLEEEEYVPPATYNMEEEKEALRFKLRSTKKPEKVEYLIDYLFENLSLKDIARKNRVSLETVRLAVKQLIPLAICKEDESV